MLHNLIEYLEPNKNNEEKNYYLKDIHSFESLQTILSDLKSFSNRKAEK